VKEYHASKSNALLKYAEPIILLSEPLSLGNFRGELNENYGELVFSAFSTFEEQANAHNIPEKVIRFSKYALAAYVDECVLSSEWSGKIQWKQSPLQLQFFNEHLAGEHFFDRLLYLRKSLSKYIDVLEIYYVCLTLGFEGRYRSGDLEALEILKVDIWKEIVDVRHGFEKKLVSDLILDSEGEHSEAD